MEFDGHVMPFFSIQIKYQKFGVETSYLLTPLNDLRNV
jgi:hypothetical protein